MARALEGSTATLHVELGFKWMLSAGMRAVMLAAEDVCPQAVIDSSSRPVPPAHQQPNYRLTDEAQGRGQASVSCPLLSYTSDNWHRMSTL